jgi:flagellar protein FliJ
MSALDSLIRLHRWQLDERQRDLATLEALAASLAEERRRLEAEDRREREAAVTAPETAFAYAGYVRAMIERKRKLNQSEAEISSRILGAREALAEAFQEVKRYEIAAASRAKQQAAKLARIEQQALDELGIEGHRRRTAGEN